MALRGGGGGVRVVIIWSGFGMDDGETSGGRTGGQKKGWREQWWVGGVGGGCGTWLWGF